MRALTPLLPESPSTGPAEFSHSTQQQPFIMSKTLPMPVWPRDSVAYDFSSSQKQARTWLHWLGWRLFLLSQLCSSSTRGSPTKCCNSVKHETNSWLSRWEVEHYLERAGDGDDRMTTVWGHTHNTWKNKYIISVLWIISLALFLNENIRYEKEMCKFSH